MTFPQAPLDLRCELNLAGTWTDVSGWLYQRDGSSAPVSISRGKPDEATQANPGACAFELDNRDGRFSPRNPASPYFPLLGQNTPVRFSVPSLDPNCLRVEGDRASGASTPLAPVHAGVLDVRMDIDLSDWQGCSIVGGAGTGEDGDETGWVVGLATDDYPGIEGRVDFAWTNSGTIEDDVQCPLPLPLGRQCLRVTLASTKGTVTFYTAPAGTDLDSGTWTQLYSVTPLAGGNPIIGLGTTAAGLFIGAAGGRQGFTGKLYRLSVYKSAVLLADFDATAAAPGTTGWTDSAGNAWTLGGTAEISDRDYRFSGEMSSLPGKWDVTGKDVSVPVAAGGVLRRLGQGDAPAMSAIRRAVTSGQPPGVTAYWPMEDGALATQFGSAMGGLAGTWSGGGVTPATDSTFNCSGPLPQLGNAAVIFRPGTYESGTGVVVRFLFVPGSTMPSSGTWGIAYISMSIAYPVGALYVNAYPGGYIGLAGYGQGGAQVFNSGSQLSAPDGALVSVEVTYDSSAGSVTYALWTLAPGDTSAAGYTTTVAGAGWHNVAWVQLNPQRQLTDSVIGHLWIQNADSLLAGLASPLSSWDGERSAHRLARVCGENNIPARITGAPCDSAVMGPQPIDTLLDILQECEDADRGMIYEPRQVTGIAFRTLASMLAQAPLVVADYAASQPGGAGGDGSDSGFAPTYDDQYLRNDLILTRGSGNVSGGTYQYQLADGSPMSVSPPPAGIGDYGDSDNVNVQADGQLPDIAAWRVHQGTSNEARYPVIPWNLARRAVTPALAAALRQADTGDVIQIANLPAQQTPDPVRQLVPGVAESLGGFRWMISHNAIPASPYDVVVLDDPVRGRVDTDGSSLAAAAGPGDTALQVASTGIVWDYTGQSVPFDISLNGERCTVTAVSGTASPQTFTVVRSVNGVSKAQPAGAPVSLWQPNYLAIGA